jgi:hypothetical protein
MPVVFSAQKEHTTNGETPQSVDSALQAPIPKLEVPNALLAFTASTLKQEHLVAKIACHGHVKMDSIAQ